ncbi:hypothetical protein [Psychroserpens luteus]|uniref:hypothetical protein n=1 Tax=Psychroserpens luteus TaxID=1434066 RepID=UPI0036D2C215
MGVESGPKLLNNISIEKIIINSEEFLTISNPSFHSYKVKDNKLTICDANLGDSIILKDENLNNSNTTIVFKVLFDDFEGFYENLQHINEPISIALNLVFDFQDAQGLTMRYSGTIENFRKGTISKPTIERTKSIVLTQINLIGLFLFIAALSLWNYGWNREIHQQKTEFFSHEFFTATIGVLATFLGLSFKKIKSLFAVFTGTLAFFKFPELHLSLEQFRGFSNKQWSMMLIALVGVSSYFIYENWSFKMVSLEGDYKLYDTVTKSIVTNDRIYYSNILEDRFRIINNNSEPYEGHMHIGRIKAQSIFKKPEVLYDSLTVILGSNKQSKQEYKTTNVAYKLIKNETLSKENISIDKLLTTCPTKLNNYMVEYFPNISLGKSVETVLIKDYINISTADLEELKKIFTNEEFKKIPPGRNKYKVLYENRSSLISKFVYNLENKFSSKHKIETHTLISVTKSWFSEIQGDKAKAIERQILLTGIWEYVLNNLELGAFQIADIASVSDLAYSVYERHTDWLVARMSVNFLLTFQKNLPNSQSKIPLEKIKNDFITLSEDKFNVIDLIFISAKNDVINNNILSNYIVENLRKINLYNSDTEMYTAILKINESNERHKLDYLHTDPLTIKQINSFCQQKSIKDLYNNLNKKKV